MKGQVEALKGTFMEAARSITGRSEFEARGIVGSVRERLGPVEKVLRPLRPKPPSRWNGTKIGRTRVAMESRCIESVLLPAIVVRVALVYCQSRKRCEPRGPSW